VNHRAVQPAAGRSCTITLVALVAVSLFAAGGCGMIGAASATDGREAGQPSPTAATAAGTPSPTAASGLGDSVRDAGDIPDPCTMFTKAEIVGLTGRDITQIDEDGGNPGDASRYCQWQQDGGQLAVFLSRTTADDFAIKIDGATPVEGVREDAFELAGHLYVLYGTVAVDVYCRGDSDAENLAKATLIAKTILPKI
jgi:Protein of unknown function (DUF3558)